MDIPILFEDADLLVIDKPYGLVVNRADSVKDATLQDWAETRIKINEYKIKNEDNADFWQRNGVVHRLDKETSGCLILAKNPESFIYLQQAFKNRLVKKTYQALVHGKIVSRVGAVNAPIGRLPWNREKFGVIPGGKEAETKYQVINFYQKDNQNFSLLYLFPKTGRTHQIRVHLKYLGFPIVGDYLYAGRKQQLHDRKWCPRVFLHAQKISFPHPKNEHKIISVASPMPSDLVAVLGLLNQV